jgi:large subunit ribosomal protein L22
MKARLVVDMIRGKNVNEALAILQYTNKRAADGVEKCVRSAIANASEAAEKANIAIDPDDLWVKAAFVDRGPTKHRRRVRPAPQGRAYREQRHFCNITILLSSDERAEEVESQKKGNGKAGDAKSAQPAESKNRKRGGAAAAPRAKRTAPPAAETAKEETASGTPEQSTAAATPETQEETATEE